ncbi:MAG: peroxide stress protein YaaA [Parvularculaceae bacterium]
MLMLLSPAKAMNFDPAPGAPKATKPVLLKHTAELAETTRKLTRSKIKTLMGISEKLADLNYERFQAFKTSGAAPGVKQAVLAFNGDVYLGLDAKTLKAEDLAFAQDHLRILSGLYGVLRPLDAIQPYRLVMGVRLKTARGATLYDFWGDLIAKEIDKAVKGHKDPSIVNLASNEYFSAVDRKALKARVITPVFKEIKDGRAKSLMLYAKQARGMMARWAIENRVERAEDLKEFSVGGYKFKSDDSDEATWVFSRPQPKPKAATKKKAA